MKVALKQSNKTPCLVGNTAQTKSARTLKQPAKEHGREDCSRPVKQAHKGIQQKRLQSTNSKNLKPNNPKEQVTEQAKKYPPPQGIEMTFHKPAEMKETFMAPKKQIITASKPNVSSNIKEKPQSSSCLRLPKQDLHPCKDCGRKFLLEALQRHEKICKKVFQSKRKQFNSAKQRIASKEQLIIAKRNKGKNIPKKLPEEATPIWKQQSQAFRNAMKQAKLATAAQQKAQVTQPQKPATKCICRICGIALSQQMMKHHEATCNKQGKKTADHRKRK